MTTSAGATVVTGVSYNAASQLLGMTYNGIGETRGYNVLNQLTSIHAGSTENLTYNYPTGTNNGKLSSMYSAVSVETITYTYDSLNRLLTANGSGWGGQYTFDSFGNLNAKTVTSGSGPSLSVTTNPANNQMEGLYEASYDANGNLVTEGVGGVGYDAENRVSAVYTGGSANLEYGYDAQNRRTFMWPGTTDTFGDSNPTGYSVVMYSPMGQKLGTYQINTYNTSVNNIVLSMCSTLMSSDQYFGGRRLAVIDQLGSVGTYYPWGENKGSTNPQNTWGFGTYWQDSASGLDYANNRYYNNAYGRFMTPDPYMASGGPSDPQSWNRYAYTRGDPTNSNDPTGQYICDPDYGCGGPEGACDIEAFTGETDPSCDTDTCFAADGFTPMPGPNCPPDGPTQTTIAKPPPCTSYYMNIYTTLTNLGQDIFSITAQKDAGITPSDLLALGLTITSDVQSEMLNTGAYFNGGHFFLDLSLSSVANDFGGTDTLAFKDFQKLFNPSSFLFPNGNGRRYPTPVPTTDPNHTYYLHDHNNDGVLDFHFDQYNPYHHFPIGAIQHGAVDFLYGHLGVHCLDPAWR
jgi:RHS repeat-associated protein